MTSVRASDYIFDGEKYIAKRKKRLLKSTVQFIKTILFVTIMIFTFLIVNSLTIAKFKINFYEETIFLDLYTVIVAFLILIVRQRIDYFGCIQNHRRSLCSNGRCSLAPLLSW